MLHLRLLRTSFLVLSPLYAADDLLINRLGYELGGPKTAVVRGADGSVVTTGFEVLDKSGKIVVSGDASGSQTVPGWGKTDWKVLDFSSISDTGTYRLVAKPAGDTASFTVRPANLLRIAGPAVIGYFNSMRNTDAADRKLPYFGEAARGTHDAYGGWNDATGDDGKYLSHLSYANFMNPQQIPMVVWSVLRARLLAPATTESFKDGILSEAAWGADYLLRMQDTSGYFYINAFREGWSGPKTICAWIGDAASQGRSTSDYQAAWREGGGMSIAALALASRMEVVGDSTSASYLAGAKRGFEHLSARKGRWADDGRENLIDHYCALLAATELYMATREARYLDSAGVRADSIVARQRPEGWLVSDAGARPFFHGVDEGLPMVALATYLEADPLSERAVRIRRSLAKSVAWYRKITREVANPFVYPRMYAPLAPVGGSNGSGNVALGKKAWATSIEAAGREAEKAVGGVDGAGNRWASAIDRNVGVSGFVQSLVVDLADRYQIGSVALSWETAKAAEFKILVAVDTSRWDTIQSVVDSTSNLRHKFTFSDSLWARYVKIVCTKRMSINWPYSIQELTVVGRKEFVPVTQVPSRTRFFMPHKNETDYWWQGENARLGSMAAGLLLAGRASGWNFGKDSLSQEVIAPLDWVVGKNPTNLNFMFGVNGGDYASYNGGTNRTGGICNGITSVSDTVDEPVFNNDGGVANWRWVEQWLPHDANFLLGAAAVAHAWEFPSEQVGVEAAVRKTGHFRLNRRGSSIDVESGFATGWSLHALTGNVVARADGEKARFLLPRGTWLVVCKQADGSRVSKTVVMP